jgi:phage FluMu gp28-like protein
MDPEVPVIRWQPPARNFVDWRDDQRFREVRVWCEGELASVLENMGRDPVWIGEDFGRNVDLTAIWPLQQMPRLMYKTPFLLELSDCPFSQQEQIFCFVCDRLHKFAGGALDKGGNGAFLAERARQHYGQHRIEEVHFADSWNLENWPPARAALEDRTVTIPRDNQVLEDFRAVKKVKGVPKVPRDARTENRTGNKRHGDTAIAYVLSMFAARSFAAGGPAEYEPVSANRMAAVKGAF